MGSGRSPEQAAKDAANRQQFELGEKIYGVEKGKIKTPAQVAFERGLKETAGSQIGVSRSGTGGSQLGRARDLNTAQTDLNIRGEVARQILKDQELSRLRNVQENFADTGAGLESAGLQNQAAIIGAYSAGAGSLLDTQKKTKKKQQQ